MVTLEEMASQAVPVEADRPPTLEEMAGVAPQAADPLLHPTTTGGLIHNTLAGMNRTIAEALNLPTDVVEYAAQKVGIPMPRIAPGYRAFRALGIATAPERGEENSAAYKIGRQMAVDVLLSLGTSGAAALGKAATPSNTTLNNVMATLADHPALMAVMSLGAAPGAAAGGALAEGAESGGAVTGLVGGAVAGTRVPGGLLTKVPAAIAGGITGAYAGAQLPNEVDRITGEFAGALLGTGAVGAGIGGVRAGVRALGPTPLGKGVAGAAKFAGQELDDLGLTSGLGPVVRSSMDNWTGTNRTIVRPTALLDNAIDPENARVFAQQQIQGDLAHIETMINDVITGIPQPISIKSGQRIAPETAGQTQKRVYKQLNDVEKDANHIEDRYWAQVPKKTVVPEAMIIPELQAAVADMAGKMPSGDIPYNIVNEVAARYAPISPRANRVGTVEQLINIRAQARQERRAEAAQVAPNDRKIANLNRVEEIINDAIMQALPDNAAIQRAREVSRVVHSIFGQGPVADIMRMTRRGDPSVPPEKIVEVLLNRTGGIASMQNIIDKLRAVKPIPGRPGAPRPFAYPQEATPQEMARIADLETGYQDAIRGMFRDAANVRGLAGEAAEKWLTTHRISEVAPIARLSAQFTDAKLRLNALLDYREALESSAFAKFAGADSRNGVKAIFADPDPSKRARSIMAHIGHDADAVQALRTGLSEELFQRGRISVDRSTIDPVAVMRWYLRPEINRLFKEQMPADWNDRLERMLSTATGIQKGEIVPAGRRGLIASLPIVRIAGAQIGTLISHVFGRGNIQVPGMFAQWGKSLVMNALLEQDPIKLLAKAISDPDWERFLLSKAPTTQADFKTTVRLIRRVLAAESTAREEADRRWRRDYNRPEPIPTAWDTMTKPQFAATWMGEPAFAIGYVDMTKPSRFRASGEVQSLQWNRNLARPNAFQAAIEGMPEGAQIEDRRGPEFGTMNAYRELINSMDRAGFSHVGRASPLITNQETGAPFGGFVRRAPPFTSASQIPLPRARPNRRPQ